MDWRQEAACFGTDINMWYPGPEANTEIQRRICEGCPVKKECLSDALTYDDWDDYGYRAGLSHRARNKMRRATTGRIAS